MDALRPLVALGCCILQAAGTELTVRLELRDPRTGEFIAAPSITVPSGETAAFAVVGPDGAGLRARLTPTLRADGAIDLRHDLTLGPQRPARAPAPSGPVFHSVLPAEGLFSVESPGHARAWLRMGDKAGEWTLSEFDPRLMRLTLSRKAERLRLGLAPASWAEQPGEATITALRPGEVVALPLREGEGEATLRVTAKGS